MHWCIRLISIRKHKKLLRTGVQVYRSTDLLAYRPANHVRQVVKGARNRFLANVSLSFPLQSSCIIRICAAHSHHISLIKREDSRQQTADSSHVLLSIVHGRGPSTANQSIQTAFHAYYCAYLMFCFEFCQCSTGQCKSLPPHPNGSAKVPPHCQTCHLTNHAQYSHACFEICVLQYYSSTPVKACCYE